MKPELIDLAGTFVLLFLVVVSVAITVTIISDLGCLSTCFGG